MEVPMKTWFTIFLALTLSSFSACAPDRVPKAVFIIVDGIPADVLESVSTPQLDSIGSYTHAWVGGEAGGETETPTISAVSYNSLITGTWANKHNVWGNEIKAPDYRYWDIFRIAKNHDPAQETAIFSTWLHNRTKLVGDGIPGAGGKKIDYAFDGFELDDDRFPHDEQKLYLRDIDELVSKEAARYLESEGPDLSWVYLEFTDTVSHQYGDSPEQIAAVELMDKQVGRIWQAIRQRRQQNPGEDWLIVVTTDHGRTADDGKGHGGQSERERTIWIVCNSNRVNGRFEASPAIVDILPSIATHMNWRIPDQIQAAITHIETT
jgi:predicted AlkP superfamily pyrophosphatase or phosphodiesterase